MKYVILKLSGFAFLFVSTISCDNEKPNQQVFNANETHETEILAKTDNATEVIGDIFFQIFEDEESLDKLHSYQFFPDCGTITVKKNNNIKEIVIDYGSDGCKLKNGRVISGMLNLTYKVDTDASALIIDYTLENFYVDGVNFEGSKTVTRRRMNQNGYPQHTMSMGLVVTFQDGVKVSRTETKTREWIEGSFSGDCNDNTFLISGSWETNFTNGNVYNATITTPLRREAGCKFIVSGTIDVKSALYGGALDYGDGFCDNLAVFIMESGEEREIRL